VHIGKGDIRGLKFLKGLLGRALVNRAIWQESLLGTRGWETGPLYHKEKRYQGQSRE